jgi:hypothetical protein
MAILQIPIAKAGKGVTFPVDSDIVNDLPPEIFLEIIAAGLEKFLNSRMSKLEAPSKLEGDALAYAKSKALTQAQQNLDDLQAGRLRKKGKASSSSDVPRDVMIEATRQAKDKVKTELRKADIKISHVSAAEITKWAKELVATDPSFIEMAREELAKRAEIRTSIDFKAVVQLDPKRIAAAEKAKATRKTQLSATQAGLPKKGGLKPVPRRGEATPHIGALN